MTLATKQKLADYDAFFKRWGTRAHTLTEKALKRQSQYEIVLLKSLDFDYAYKELKVKLEFELSSRVAYLRYEALPTTIPDEAIIDMTSCEVDQDIFFTIEELMIFCGYSPT